MSRRPAVRILACIAAVVAFQTINVLLVGGLGWPLWAAAGLTGGLGVVLALLARRYFRRHPSARRVRLKPILLWGAGVYALLVILGAMAWAVMVVLANPVSGDVELVHGDEPGLRVLLVGNRLTSDNGMADMLRTMAARDAGAKPIFVVQYAHRHSTLDRALDDSRLRDLLDDEHWDYVVLQEHGLVVSRSDERRRQMLPAATALNAMARQRGARTVLFQNWGYRDGDPAVPGDTYDAMQSRLLSGLRDAEVELVASVAPVGRAWQVAMSRAPRLRLWSSDGVRPNRIGSYLSASVLYSALTHRHPRRIAFTAGLDPDWARYLREVAGYTISLLEP